MKCTIMIGVLLAGALSAAPARPQQTPPGDAGAGPPDVGGSWCRILTPPGQPEGAYAANTWPRGVVPYVFVNVTPAQQQIALAAMAEIEGVCNVDFIPRTTETNYIIINAHLYANSSFVGMVGGAQAVNISAWPMRFIIVHELGHALGLWHEQQRPDRDSYVTINLGNVLAGFGPNFTIPAGVTAFGPYDFDSVMHYPRHLWTGNGLETITVLPAYQAFRFLCGLPNHLSNGDIWVLTQLYGGRRPPRVFELVAPAHRTAVGNAWMPVFEWTASELADSYQLVADDHPSFASPEISVALNGTSYAAPALLPAGRVFFWKVTAVNATGQTLAWPQTVRCFYTETGAPSVLYVDDSAPAGGNGAAWATPMRDLQDALALADCSGGLVAEVRVGQGVYKPDRGTGDRGTSFPLVGGLTVLGGYAGINAPDPNARDPELYVTTLTGDLAGDDLPGFINYAENSLHVLLGEGLDQAAVLDGLTITGGNADGGPGITSGSGGGVYASDAPIHLERCRIVANSAALMGGGILAFEGSTIEAHDCTFEGNRQVAPVEAFAFSGGGALYQQGSSATLERCMFGANSAFDGAAVCMAGSAGTIRDCLFENNAARHWGGAVGALNTVGRGLCTIDRCIFTGNSVANVPLVGGYGGAVANHGYPSVLSNCLFTGNTAAFAGGGLSNGWGGTATLRNCTFVGNAAPPGLGGAIYNTVLISGGGTSTLSGANCVVRANTSGQIVSTGGTATTVTYSNVEGGFPGTGNIAIDPLFLNPASGNYRLGALSPCVDAGSNLTVPAGVALDLDGNPRFVDDPCAPNTGVPGGAGGPAIVDMGAYERQLCYPDCNGTIADFGCFQTKFVLGCP